MLKHPENLIEGDLIRWICCGSVDTLLIIKHNTYDSWNVYVFHSSSSFPLKGFYQRYGIPKICITK